MSLIEFIIVCLAVCRLASLFTEELGPFDIFLRIRRVFGVVHDDDGEVISRSSNSKMGYLFTCFWCFSVCIAIPLSILLYFWREAMLWILLPFAMSAGAILLRRDR